LPAPTQVVDKAIQMTTAKDAVLLADIKISATRVLTGFLLSVLVGVPAGLIINVIQFYFSSHYLSGIII